MGILIEKVKKLDDELYKAKYIDHDYSKVEKLWNSIKADNEILAVAIKIVKDKFQQHDTFLAISIVELMLIDYENIDKELYQLLISILYSNTDLARIVLEGYANGGYSFLLMTLFNESLILTENQKKFAIEEAMNKIGTTKYEKLMSDYDTNLDAKGITDNIDVVAPEIGLIGAKTFNTYMASMVYGLNTNQAHGTGEFDIRYWILRNPNFADQIATLVYDFYASDEEYEDTFDYIERSICGDIGRDNDEEPIIYMDDLVYVSEKEFLARLPIEQATKIIKEINFFKKMRELRPIHHEMQIPVKKEMAQ